jgi:UDP-glucuronate decarboxylase
VVSNFIMQALQNEPITIYGDGAQTRSLCYVDDLVDGLIRLMNVDGRHEPVNLGNPVEFTIRELAEEVVKVVGGQTRVTYKPLPQDDPAQRQPDISRARDGLGWGPTVQLAEGLQLTVEDFRQRLKRRNRASVPVLDERLTSPGLLD